MVFFLVIAFIVFSPRNRHTVVPTYRDASNLWWQGETIYPKGIHGYLYLPQSAILFTPFARLPFQTAEVLWRGFTMGFLAWAVFRLARFAGRRTASPAGNAFWELFPLVTLLVIPPAMDAARNGQMSLPWVSTMVLATIAMGEKRWWTGVFWLSLGFAIKPLILAFILVSAALYPPLRWRLIPGLAAAFLFPFLTAAPDYVWGQYGSFLKTMRVAGNPGMEQPFSDIFGLTKFLGLMIPFEIQLPIRLAAAGGTLLLAWRGARRWPHEEGVLYVLAIVICYTMLFSSRTENNTYVVLGIPMALFGACAILVERTRGAAILFPLLCIGITAGHELSRGPNIWLCPFTCLIFAGYLISLLQSGRARLFGKDGGD